jgi:hypothetical protein
LASNTISINQTYKSRTFEIGDKSVPDLTGKIEILGVTAAGVSNPVASPSGAVFPHQMQASILETLLNGDSVSIPNWVDLADLVALLILTILVIALARWKYGIVPIALIIGGYVYLPVYLFATKHILFDISFNVYDAMLERMHDMKEAPKKWDGVFRATSK